MSEFVSVEAIDKHFKKLIAETESEDEKRVLSLEQREATADFRIAAAGQRELEAHKTAVIAEKGLSEWADFVTGATVDEIDAAANKIAERVSKLTEVREREEARAAYGPAGTGTGGDPTGSRPDEAVEKMQAFERNFNESTRGSALRRGGDAKVGIPESERYVAQVLGARAVDHLARNSAKPEMRAAASRIDTATLKAKQ